MKRKRERKRQISIRLENMTVKAIDEKAKKERRERSELIRLILADAVGGSNGQEN
jgi:metal-responsive CopG/Arc/MetJ family transcriptional regulator